MKRKSEIWNLYTIEVRWFLTSSGENPVPTRSCMNSVESHPHSSVFFTNTTSDHIHPPNLSMSFGRPPSINVGFKVTAPDRGSFPLDHYGLSTFSRHLFSVTEPSFVSGECKDKMKLYMACLKENGSTSSPCRSLSKEYLDCRMNK